MQINDARVTIVGLGLMGGSLAMALRGKCREVVGVARREDSVRLARDCGAVDWGTCDLTVGVAHADIVVLATPVCRIIELIPVAASAMRSNALLMDMGSTKRHIVNTMNLLPAGQAAVGGHPMCGKEVGGLEHADRALFEGARFVLTPTERSAPAAMELAGELARAVGACPIVLDAETHDRAVATISHMPYLLAASLVHTEQEASLRDPVVSALAAGGFRDTSRVAGSEVAMMRDILLTNRDEIERALDLFERNLAHARRLLSEQHALEQWMEQAQARRMGMLVMDDGRGRGDGRWTVDEDD